MSVRDALKSATSKIRSKVGDLGFSVQGENFALELGKAAKAEAKAEAKDRKLSSKERKDLEAEIREELAREYAASGLAKDSAAVSRVRAAPPGGAFRALRPPGGGGGLSSALIPVGLLAAAIIAAGRGRP